MLPPRADPHRDIAQGSGQKQSPINIKSAPAAMIQLAVFEDMNSQPSGGRENAADEPRATLRGSMPNIAGCWLKLQMTKVTFVAEA